MKADAEAKKLPPVYRGRWASAPRDEVDAMLASGAPHCYRFRVPPGEEVAIDVSFRFFLECLLLFVCLLLVFCLVRWRAGGGVMTLHRETHKTQTTKQQPQN